MRDRKRKSLSSAFRCLRYHRQEKCCPKENSSVDKGRAFPRSSKEMQIHPVNAQISSDNAKKKPACCQFKLIFGNAEKPPCLAVNKHTLDAVGGQETEKPVLSFQKLRYRRREKCCSKENSSVVKGTGISSIKQGKADNPVNDQISSDNAKKKPLCHQTKHVLENAT